MTRDTQFVQMIRQYERLVYTICFQFTKNHHTAEDLTQETFLSAYRHRSTCPSDNPKPWLARIAINKSKDYLKSAYFRKTKICYDTCPDVDASALYPHPEQPEDLTLSMENLKEIHAEIMALKEPYHKASVLYFLQEKSVGEIAEILDRPPKTVHTQLYRAKQILQKKLQRRNFGGDLL